MKIFFRLVLALVLAAAIAIGWLWYEGARFLSESPVALGADECDVYVDIPPGASLRQVAAQLKDQGLVTDATKFRWLARWKNEEKNIQSGRFRLNTAMRPQEVLDTLAHGMPALHRITIPEGLTWWQTGKLLADAGFVNYGDFQEIVHDPAFLRHHGIPFASAEGFLMPDTYLMPKLDKPLPVPGTPTEEADKSAWREQTRSIASRLVDNFWRKGTLLWAPDNGAPVVRPTPEDLKKWVILASIVEKETGVPSERARVAGVYANRLAKNMLLQADPTVIYGLGPDFTGRLRRVHLDDTANVYNTYQRSGLPPGPIASFGMAALKAAINPEKHNYLFFVATGEGDSHTFTRTFEEHTDAVREYRRKIGR